MAEARLEPNVHQHRACSTTPAARSSAQSAALHCARGKCHDRLDTNGCSTDVRNALHAALRLPCGAAPGVVRCAIRARNGLCHLTLVVMQHSTVHQHQVVKVSGLDQNMVDECRGDGGEGSGAG
eukprot:CAMPEP_0202875314 /NCGR_PEP_ID=MMETSP1391-20130828/27070_1 /ASSEMBLY_ACC=CAM_ASM_000867 /TAXON_ID=1034604 /ORGANISM="Chlamydomonas leiostraca, Strain SAG 11-49" /LENGTH=123 /DNA_ID=CAMNT_0049556963 /DNA_START=120 /DNA_END=492 /DNA_ORIENTATION=-